MKSPKVNVILSVMLNIILNVQVPVQDHWSPLEILPILYFVFEKDWMD